MKRVEGLFLVKKLLFFIFKSNSEFDFSRSILKMEGLCDFEFISLTLYFRAHGLWNLLLSIVESRRSEKSWIGR